MKTQGERPKLHWKSSAPGPTHYPNQFAPASHMPTNGTTARQHAELSLLVGARVAMDRGKYLKYPKATRYGSPRKNCRASFTIG